MSSLTGVSSETCRENDVDSRAQVLPLLEGHQDNVSVSASTPHDIKKK